MRAFDKPRVGQLPPLPRDWGARCRRVRRRDQHKCRFCGWEINGNAGIGAVDHLLPRRIAPAALRDAPRNTILLCAKHHSFKTGRIERQLFTGRTDTFEWFLSVVATTGPIPAPSELAQAYATLRRLVFDA